MRLFMPSGIYMCQRNFLPLNGWKMFLTLSEHPYIFSDCFDTRDQSYRGSELTDFGFLEKKNHYLTLIYSKWVGP